MSSTPESQLVEPTMLFRFSVPCRKQQSAWNGDLITLPDDHAIHSFGEMSGRPVFADLRAGWSEAGLIFTLTVTGKQQSCWCREQKIEDSDGLRIWINTRDTQSIHRASRFCHQFVFLPSGGGGGNLEAVAAQLPIGRAKEQPRPVPHGGLSIVATEISGGYQLTALVRAESLTGFDHQEHPRLGFSYAVVDRELGWQTFSLGPEYPFMSDPSLWGTLQLVES